MGPAACLWIQKLQRDCPRTDFFRTMDIKSGVQKFCFIEIFPEPHFLTRSGVFTHGLHLILIDFGNMKW